MIDAPTSNMAPGPPNPAPPSSSSSSSERRSPGSMKRAYSMIGAAALVLFLGLLIGLVTRGGDSSGHHATQEAAAAATGTPQVTTTTSTFATSSTDSSPPDAAASSPAQVTGTTTNTTTMATPVAATTATNKAKGVLGSLLNAQQQQAQQMGTTVGDALSASYEVLHAAKQATSTFISVAGCTPSTGEELIYMVEETNCRTITLKPNTNYSIQVHIAVSRPVSIIGRPLGMPTIDAKNSTRAFYVDNGGFLDLRFVRVIKGRFIEVIPFVEYHLRAPTCYIRSGGVAIFTGCHFTIDFMNALRFFGITPPFTNIRVFGGGIVSERSTIRVQDCLFYSWRPGIAFREIQFIGAEFLVLGGSVFLTGNMFVNSAIFSNSLGVGGYVANLGGVVVITGCLFSYSGAFVVTQGIGFLFFCSGGVTSATGCIVTTDIGMAGFFGGGIGMFTGSGVSSMCGFIYSANIVLGMGAGIGFQNAIGAGVNIRTGVIQSSMGSIACAVGAGTNTFIGAGVGVFTFTSGTRSTAILSFYGVGSAVYVGAGVLTTTNTLGIGITGITSAALAGGDTALLAGWWTRTNALVMTATAIAFFVGQGADTFIGLGGMALTNVAFVSAPTPIGFANPGLAAVYVAGNNVILVTPWGRGIIYKKVTATKKGQTDWSRNIFIARKTSWRFSGAGPRESDYLVGRQRRSLLEEEQRKPALPSLATVVKENAKKKQEERELLEEVQKELLEKTKETAAAAGAGGDGVARALYTNKPHPKTPHFHTTRNLGVKTSFDVKPVIQSMLNEYVGDGGGNGATTAVKDTMQGLAIAKAALNTTETVTDATATAMGIEEGTHTINTTAFANHPWYYFANLPGLKVEKSKTNKIYVASKLDSCSVCGVTPGNTFDNIDGPGAEDCKVANACEHVDGAEAMSKASAVLADGGTRSDAATTTEAEDLQAALGDDVIKQMWVVGRNESTPDTVVSTVDLRATFTPAVDNGVYTTVNKEQVLAAVTEAITTLGVSNRWHLRVEDSTDAPKNFDSLLTLSAANTQGTEDAAMGAGHDYGSMDLGEVAGQQECGRNELFKAYVVSDWKNVTDAVNHALKTSGGQKALTAALQAQVSNTSAASITATTICSLSAYRTTSLFIPANTVAGISHAPESSSHSVVPVTRRTTMVTRRRRRLAGEEGGPEGEEIEMEEEEEEDDDQTMAVLGQGPQIALTLPPPKQHSPFAMLRELPPRVDEALRSDDYAIVLTSFPPGQLLTVRLVPDKGDDVVVGTLISLPHPVTKQQVYRWSPDSSMAVQALQEGAYYLEVTSQKGDAFAYSQAFELI